MRVCRRPWSSISVSFGHLRLFCGVRKRKEPEFQLAIHPSFPLNKPRLHPICGPVVQWIERPSPKGQIWVRFPSGLPIAFGMAKEVSESYFFARVLLPRRAARSDAALGFTSRRPILCSSAYAIYSDDRQTILCRDGDNRGYGYGQGQRSHFGKDGGSGAGEFLR